MKKKAYRTTMPFDNRSTGSPAISPPTQKSVIPTNNIPTILDVLNGTPYRIPGAGGSWGKGDEDQPGSFKDKGDDYKRDERDLEIFQKMSQPPTERGEVWKVKTPGGSVSFPSLPLAQKYKKQLEDSGKKVIYMSLVTSSGEKRMTRFAEVVSVVEQSINKTFLVESTDPVNRTIETGSAFCVVPNYFVTCAHVVRPYDKNTIKDVNPVDYQGIMIKLKQNGATYKADLTAIDLSLDIAILHSDAQSVPFELDETRSIGEDIVAISSPHGFENEVSSGVIGSEDREVYFYNGAPKYMFVDLSIFPGSSGGPVIKKSNGKVVGMVTLIVSGEGESSGLNACLPAEYIKTFVGKELA